jgi:hypothetical protein
MGSPNVDFYLVKTISEFLSEVQRDPAAVVETLFEDAPGQMQAEIAQWIGRQTITSDFRDRREGALYVIPSMPLADLPFPQIAAYVGSENDTEFMLGSDDGEPTQPIMEDGEIVGWQDEMAVISSGQWRVDIVCGSRYEAIWLSRLCQLALRRKLLEMDGLGIKEVSLSLADLQLDHQRFPQAVYARGIMMQAKVVQTWTDRLPVSFYQTGVNLAVE